MPPARIPLADTAVGIWWRLLLFESAISESLLYCIIIDTRCALDLQLRLSSQTGMSYASVRALGVLSGGF